MKTITLTALVCAYAAAAPALAQTGEQPIRKEDPAKKTESAIADSRYCKIGDLLGATVRLSPTEEERVQAAEKGKEPSAAKGEIKDLVVRSDGKIDWAVISVGGLLGIGDKTVAVPFTALTLDEPVADKKCCTLGLTKAELKSRPDFDASRAKKDGLENTVRAMDEHLATPREAGAKKSDTPADRTGIDVPNLILASELKSCGVRCTDDSFGKVDDCFVDPSQRSVNLITISHGGVLGVGDTVHLVPLKATRLVLHDGDRILLIDKTEKQMEAAPNYVKPDIKNVVVSPENARQAEDFYAGKN